MKPWDFRELPPLRQAELTSLYLLHQLREAHINHASKQSAAKKKPSNNVNLFQ